jgi:hypothetical protein
MAVIQIFKNVALLGTVGIGIVSMFWPRSVQGFTGLKAPGGRGITEIRAILGAFFVGLGLLPFILGTPETYQMLGYTYLIVAVVRGIFMFVDRSVERSNIISVISEVILGVILVV